MANTFPPGLRPYETTTTRGRFCWFYNYFDCFFFAGARVCARACAGGGACGGACLCVRGLADPCLHLFLPTTPPTLPSSLPRLLMHIQRSRTLAGARGAGSERQRRRRSGDFLASTPRCGGGARRSGRAGEPLRRPGAGLRGGGDPHGSGGGSRRPGRGGWPRGSPRHRRPRMCMCMLVPMHGPLHLNIIV